MNIFLKHKIKIKQALKKTAKSLEVLVLVLLMIFANIPSGVLDFLSEKWSERNVVDVMWLAQNSTSVVDSFRLKTVEAAEVTIDAGTITDATDEFGSSPTVVFTTEQTGYIFYVDVGNDLIYKKTTNGGTNWGADVVIDNVLTGWTNVSVWYDQWTPGDTTGTKIHIAAADDVTGDAYYTFLDTNDDALKGSMVAVIPQTTFTEAINAAPSITRGTGGALFLTVNFAGVAGGYVYKSIDGAGDTWNNITPTEWSSVSADQIQILPLNTDNDIIAIKAQTSDDTIRHRIYDEVSDTWEDAWSSSIASLTDNATYDQWFSATIKKSTGDVYLAFNNFTNNAANDIEFWSFADASREWTRGANVRQNSNQLLSPVPLMDEESGDIYVAYLEGANLNNHFQGGNVAAVTHLFYQKSTDGGATWGDRVGVINNDVGDDYRYLRGNLLSSDRLFVAYYDDDDDDIFGSTIWSRGVPVETNIDTAITDATDEYGPSPSGVFVDEDVGYQFYVRTNVSLDASDEFGPSPSAVFTDANTGYIFFIDATMQSLVYRKTVNGGATWSGSNIIDTTVNHGWTQVSVWYDQWTPGDTTGTLIHIAAATDVGGDVYYSYLDTNNDTLRSELVIAINQTTFTEAVNSSPSITKGASGNLFLSSNFANVAGGYVVKSIDSGNNWSNINPSASASADQIQLLPLLTNNDIIAIMADVSDDVITYQIYNEATDTWSGSWTTIAAMVDNSTYDQWFSATLNKTTGDIFLTFTNSIGVVSGDIEFWTFTDDTRAWTKGADVVSDLATILMPVPIYRPSDGTLYVIYARGSLAGTMHIYFKSSADGGTTWSTESAQLNTTGDDFKSMSGNMMSNDNLYVVWYNDDTQHLVGDRILSPITGDGHVTSAQSLVYRKTVDGGKSWGTPWTVAVTGGTTAFAVWYDQWTPGDTTGTKIHIAFSDDLTDDYYYSYFDTANDRPHPPIVVLLGTVITEAGVGVPGITKGSSGNLFLSGNFNTIAGGQVAKSTDDGASWTSITPTAWSIGATDQIQLLPLLTDNDIIAIKADVADHDIDYRIYDEINDDWENSWTEIGTLVDNATYDQWFSASLRKSTGDTYLTFANNTSNADNDIEFWSFDDGTRGWVKGANLFTDDASVMMPAPLVNESNGDLYVAYLRGTLGSATRVYYKKSTDGGVTWSNESSSLSPGIVDWHMALRGNLLSSERLYLFWYNNDLNDIYGNSIPLVKEGFLTSIEIRAQNYTTSVSAIIFPESSPGSTVSQPYNNIDGSSNPQTFGGAGAAKPAVTLYNSNASSLKIYYNITTFTNNLVTNEYYLINNKAAACADASCISEPVIFNTDTDTGVNIMAGGGNEKDLYLKIILSEVAGKSSSSTLTILGESL